MSADGPFVPGNLSESFLEGWSGPVQWARGDGSWEPGVLLGRASEPGYWWISPLPSGLEDPKGWVLRWSDQIRLPLYRSEVCDLVVRRIVEKLEVSLFLYRDQPERLRWAALVAYRHADVPRAIREALDAWMELPNRCSVWSRGIQALLLLEPSSFDLQAHHLRLTWPVVAPAGWPARVEAATAAMCDLNQRRTGA